MYVVNHENKTIFVRLQARRSIPCTGRPHAAGITGQAVPWSRDGHRTGGAVSHISARSIATHPGAVESSPGCEKRRWQGAPVLIPGGAAPGSTAVAQSLPPLLGGNTRLPRLVR